MLTYVLMLLAVAGVKIEEKELRLPDEDPIKKKIDELKAQEQEAAITEAASHIRSELQTTRNKAKIALQNLKDAQANLERQQEIFKRYKRLLAYAEAGNYLPLLKNYQHGVCEHLGLDYDARVELYKKFDVPEDFEVPKDFRI